MTYGIHVVWEYLKKKDLKTWENVKANFLKRALGISRFTPSRMAYVLAREPFLIEDLRVKFLLPSTDAYKNFLQERYDKMTEIDEDFYCTSAMIDRSWTQPNQELRHVVTRFAVHGFHHKVCVRENYHTPDSTCVCKLCKLQCHKYHVIHCKKNTKSVTVYSTETD